MSRKTMLPLLGLCAIAACRKTSQPSVPECNQISHSWSGDVVPLLTHYCTDSGYGGCHQSKSAYGDWTDYEQFKSKVDEGHVKEHCLDANEMPPPYSKGPQTLKESEKQMLRCWIENGAPKN